MAFISDDDERVCSSIRERDNSYSYAHRRQQEKKKLSIQQNKTRLSFNRDINDRICTEESY